MTTTQQKCPSPPRTGSANLGRLVFSLLLLTLFFPCSPGFLFEVPQAMASEGGMHTGRVFYVRGPSTGKTDSGRTQPLHVNDEIYAKEEITTSPGAVVILKFRDGTTFTIGPDGKAILDEFVFNPVESETKNTIQILKGAFRLISGFKTKNSQIRLHTRNATIHLHGTVVEGFVDENTPDFINIPKGFSEVETTGGKISLKEGDFTVIPSAKLPPPPTASLPMAIAAQGIELLRSEIGDDVPAATPMTPEQIQADAMASHILVKDQHAAIMTKAGSDFSVAGVFRTFLRGLVHMLRSWLETLTTMLDQFAQSFTLIRQAQAATAEDIARAMSLLMKASDMGILTPDNGPSTPEKQAALASFAQEAQRMVPDARAIVQGHQEKQTENNRNNTLSSTRDVVAGAASVVKDSQEMATMVRNAVEASPKGDGEMASVIVQGAVSAKGTTDNAQAASAIVQAASSADPSVAGNAAGSAIQGLPQEARAGAASQVSAAAAQSSPGAAAQVASAVILAAGPQSAGGVAAAVTQAAGAGSAAQVAAASSKAGGPESAAQVAAAVTQVAGSAAAVQITEAVMANAGAGQAVAIAAAVTQVAGSQAAAQVAAAVSKNLGSANAAQVAAVVSQVAGPGAAAAIVKAVAGSAGISAGTFQASVDKAAKSPTVAQAVQESKVNHEQAKANGNKASQANALAKAASQPPVNAPEADKKTASTLPVNPPQSSLSTPEVKRPVTEVTPAAKTPSSTQDAGVAKANLPSSVPSFQVPTTPEALKMASALASGVSMESVLLQAQKSGVMTNEQIIATAIQAGADPAALTQMAISLGGDPEQIAAQAIAAGADASQVATAAIQAGGSAEGVTQAAIQAGGDASAVAKAAISSGGDAGLVAAAAIKSGGDTALITQTAIQAGGNTQSVANAVIKAGADAGQVMTGAVKGGASNSAAATAIISSGGDSGKVMKSMVLSGGDLKTAASAAIAAGGDPATIVAAAVRAGANAGEVTAAVIRSGGDPGAVVKAALQAGGSPYEVVVGASSAAPNQIRDVVRSAVQTGMNPGAAESAGAAGQEMESPLKDNGRVPSPS